MTRNTTKNQRLAAVIGWPVSQSMSPIIHSTWASREGTNVRYDAIAVEPDGEAFHERINQLRAAGYAGVNVTIPHKERALKIAEDASDAAKEIGAANMLTFGDTILAENSDAMAMTSIIGSLNTKPRNALVLGAGGAARAALWALKNQGVARISIANRTASRAEEVAPIASANAIDWSARNKALEDADCIVNTTSLGMKGQPPLDLNYDGMKDSAVVFDIVYAPLETPLLKAARARGLETVDGLEMLMRQAVPGYLAWLGSKADIDADLRARLTAALKERDA